MFKISNLHLFLKLLLFTCYHLIFHFYEFLLHWLFCESRDAFCISESLIISLFLYTSFYLKKLFLHLSLCHKQTDTSGLASSALGICFLSDNKFFLEIEMLFFPFELFLICPEVIWNSIFDGVIIRWIYLLSSFFFHFLHFYWTPNESIYVDY